MTLIKIHTKILLLAIFRLVSLNTDYYKVKHKCMTRKLSTITNKLRAVKRNKKTWETHGDKKQNLTVECKPVNFIRNKNNMRQTIFSSNNVVTVSEQK